MEGSLREMNVHEMPFVNCVGVQGSMLPLSPKKLPAHQTSIHMGPGFQRDRAGRFEIEVENRSVYCVEVGTGDVFLVTVSFTNIRSFSLVLEINHAENRTM
jgi:hypothetical protein